uniref:Uncharacterized protein n=1 Tax=Trichinella nativa TaxID=6335 RepID=A0A0V1KHC8_9BILA
MSPFSVLILLTWILSLCPLVILPKVGWFHSSV